MPKTSAARFPYEDAEVMDPQRHTLRDKIGGVLRKVRLPRGDIGGSPYQQDDEVERPNVWTERWLAIGRKVKEWSHLGENTRGARIKGAGSWPWVGQIVIDEEEEEKERERYEKEGYRNAPSALPVKPQTQTKPRDSDTTIRTSRPAKPRTVQPPPGDLPIRYARPSIPGSSRHISLIRPHDTVVTTLQFSPLPIPFMLRCPTCARLQIQPFVPKSYLSDDIYREWVIHGSLHGPEAWMEAFGCQDVVPAFGRPVRGWSEEWMREHEKGYEVYVTARKSVGESEARSRCPENKVGWRMGRGEDERMRLEEEVEKERRHREFGPM